MKNIDKKKPVLVSGGSGYIASWVIKLLLDEGRYVRATVRDKSDNKKVAHLLDAAKESKGKLELHEADLMMEGSFDAAMTDCELVMHMASPFKMFKIKDPQKELIEPAVNGTKNILSSVNRNASVKRVVLTSSTVAIIGDAIDIERTENGIFNESHWNTTSSLNHQPYSYSKTLAEKAAWDMVEKQDRWDLVTINPGFVMGPSLTDRIDSTSIDFMLSALNGNFKQGVPNTYFYLVDVRDVAKAHLSAGNNPNASGRHVLVTDTIPAIEIADILREKHRDLPIPKKAMPNFLMYIFGPSQGMTWKYLKRNLGINVKFDNSYSKKDLNIEYAPLKQTLLDHADQIIKSGLV